MPSFQFTSIGEEPYSAETEASPVTTTLTRRLRAPPASANNAAGSTRLMTLSPDGRSVHSLTADGQSIETRRLPLSEEEDIDDVTNDDPVLIRTVLPDSVQNALEIDPPVELLCVEGESISRKPKQDGEHPYLQLLPRLCLYTRKSAFLLEISYNPSKRESDSVVAGNVVSLTEPFEKHLAISMQTSILRIRPAPQCSAGYATLSPASSMAVLTENTETNEYTLLLHHGDGAVTTPQLDFGIEDLVEDNGERFTDFCFAQCHGLSIFASISILFLKSSGDVLAASPVVFDGTVVARSLVDEAVTYLHGQMEALPDRNSAKWRQCKAASQYFVDVFPTTDRRSHYCTAHILKYQQEQSAAGWPIKLQGPILFHSNLDPGPLAVAIENFGSSDSLVGVAIGKEENNIDFAALSPTSLLPRFTFESATDGYDIDDALFKLASFVERVDLSQDSSPLSPRTPISLIPDPVADTLLHYATPKSVFTVSTNVMRITSHKLKGAAETETIHTTAWCCLSSNASDPVQGVVVPGEISLGHELITRRKSGLMDSVNVTESKYRHELESLFQASSERTDQFLLENSTGNAIATVPLYSEIEPLVKKINAGLAGMSRIVGSATTYKDITPDSLAVAIRVKTRCDEEVVLPVLELKKTVDKHRACLQTMLERQRNQLNTAAETVKELKARSTAIGESIEKAEANAVTLSQRSFAILQASQDLLPTVTQAEYDYFQSLKRLKLKCDQMEKEIKQASNAIKLRCESIDEVAVAETMKNFGPDHAKKANALLKAQEKVLQEVAKRFEETEKLTSTLAHQCGIAS